MKTIAKLLLSVFFVGSGVMHFLVPAGAVPNLDPDSYASIMPDYIPAHGFMIALSGVTEILAGVMLIIPRLSRWGAWFIIAQLVVFFTVHFWMIQHAEDLYLNIPLLGLWVRIPMQVFFIVWAYWFAAAPGNGEPETAEA